MPTIKHPHLRAILYALAGFACWVGGDTFIKLASMTGASKSEIMSIASASGMVAIGGLVALRGELPRLRPSRFGVLGVLTALFLANYVFFLIGLKKMPLADFYAIVFLAPIVISAVAAFYLREHLSVKQWLAILAGFVGVLIAINPIDMLHNTGKGDWQGYAAAFAAMICITMQMLTLRTMGEKESRECLAFYPRIGPLIGGLIMMALNGAEPMTTKAFIYSLAIGGVGGFGWVLVAQAYKMAPAGIIAPFQYFETVIGALVGYLVWGDVPSVHLLTGIGVIIASGIYIVRHTNAKPAPSLIAKPSEAVS